MPPTQTTLSFVKRPREDDKESTRSAKASRTSSGEATVLPTTSGPFTVEPPDFDVSDLFFDAKPDVVLKDELDLLVFNKTNPFLKRRESQLLFKYLLECLPWYRVQYNTRGINITTPRFTTVFGCDETGAESSKYKIRPRPIPWVLDQLRRRVEQATGSTFNFVLVNYYSEGKDSISWHSDDESFLGPLPTIASMSLGGSRDFAMKHKEDKSLQTQKWSLESGDMIVMRGTSQSRWLHSVPKRKEAKGRINITFRKAMSVAGSNNYYRYNVHTGPIHRFRDGKMLPAT